jgi:hypothetical protein
MSAENEYKQGQPIIYQDLDETIKAQTNHD